MPVYNVHELEVNTVLVPTLYYTLYWLVPTLCCTLYWYQPYTIQYMHCWLVPTLYCNLYRYQPCTIKYCNGWYQPCIVLYIVLLPTLYYTLYSIYTVLVGTHLVLYCTLYWYRPCRKQRPMFLSLPWCTQYVGFAHH